MKLVDILARELKEFPQGDSPLVQSSFGQVYICGGGPIIIQTSRAEDWELAEVTRAQWQAAVDALKAESAPAWVGVGLPPIGIDVEVFAEYSHPRFDRFVGQRVHIVAHDVINGDPVAVFRMPVDGDDTEQDYHAMVAGSLRPIRTPEQIAAEVRQRAIEDLGEWLSTNCSIPTPYLWEAAQKIYDAGYRKFEIVDN